MEGVAGRRVSETASGALQVVHDTLFYKWFLRSLTEPTLTRIMATNVFQVSWHSPFVRLKVLLVSRGVKLARRYASIRILS